MKSLKATLLVSAALLLAACASPKGTASCQSANSSSCPSVKSCCVPANILAAAKARVPGFAVTSCDRDTDNGRKVYELKGTANGRKCEIKVGADGKILDVDRD